MADPDVLGKEDVELTPKDPKVEKVDRDAVLYSSSGTKAFENREVAERAVRLVRYQSTMRLRFMMSLSPTVSSTFPCFLVVGLVMSRSSAVFPW